jgi:hypothetical protein
VPDGLGDATATGVPDGLADATATGVPDVGELAAEATTALADAAGVVEAAGPGVPDGVAAVVAGVPAVDAALAVTEVATAVDWLVELDCVVVEVADEVDADEEVCVAEFPVVTEVAAPAGVDGVPATLATAVVAAVLDVTG